MFWSSDKEVLHEQRSEGVSELWNHVVNDICLLLHHGPAYSHLRIMFGTCCHVIIWRSFTTQTMSLNQDQQNSKNKTQALCHRNLSLRLFSFYVQFSDNIWSVDPYYVVCKSIVCVYIVQQMYDQSFNKHSSILLRYADISMPFFFGCANYQTQVKLGSDLWVRMSVRE